MPNPRTQRVLVWLGIMGTLISCFGCTLAFNNQIDTARLVLIVAWLILVPLFFYLIILRNRAAAIAKRRKPKGEGSGVGDQGSGTLETDPQALIPDPRPPTPDP